jgi:cytochrome c2
MMHAKRLKIRRNRMNKPCKATKAGWIACGAGLLASMAVVAGPSLAQAEEGDAAKGEKVFKRCMACHQVGDSAKNSTGPVLNMVMGRTAGTFADYKYGASMVQAGEKGLVWSEETLFEYLENPKEFLRTYLGDPKAKAKMPLRLKKEDQRRDVIAYLKTLGVTE